MAVSRLREGGDWARLEALEWREGAGMVRIGRGYKTGEGMERIRHTLATVLEFGGLGHHRMFVWVFIQSSVKNLKILGRALTCLACFSHQIFTPINITCGRP